MKVKICGITRLEDALAAAAFGGDALGFIFAPGSPRRVSVETVRRIVSALPPFVTTVGVFTEGTAMEIEKAVEESGVDMIQFHGPFEEKTIHHFSHQAIQVVKVKDAASLEAVQPVPCRAVLLDTYHKKMAGGSGLSFDWALARKAAGFGKIILAGGLTPENVQEAVRQAHPYAVDVSSGVEAAKGKKDLGKMKRFIAAAKGTGDIGPSSE
ncbi:MAG: phosphoribosylanthranilate isomerase [Nitrospiria bacterium]